jgi:hypothetical protein
VNPVGVSNGEIPAVDVSPIEAISEGGKYDPRMAFLFNLNIAVWDASRREFCFPDIPDHPTAKACREHIRRTGLVLRDHPQNQSDHTPDPFTILIEYATGHAWPDINAMISRVELLRAVRNRICFA